MKQNQFIKLTDVEQNLFEKLSGQKDKVLLLYTNELNEGEEEYLEYYFTYSDTTAENFGLETFYAKVKKTSKKNLTSDDLLSKAVSRLTEKMVKRNVVEVEDLKEPPFKIQSVGSSKKSTSNEEASISPSDSSQYNYQFIAKNKSGELLTEASFCRVLENSYGKYILTCYHNIKEDATKYQLKKDQNNIVNLTLLDKETEKIKEIDAAILKIDSKNVPSDFYDKEFNPKLSSNNAKSAVGYKQINTKSPVLTEGGSGGCVFNDNLLCGVYLGANVFADIDTILTVLNLNNPTPYRLAK